MSKGIVGFLGSLEAVSEFFKEYQKEEEEFALHSDDEVSPYIKKERHHVHTEDDSITKQWRGY